MTPSQELNQSKVEAFGQKMASVLNGAAIALMASIGHQTGLFDTMAMLPPSTSHQIATAAKLQERYVREWLAAQAASGYVEYDAASDKFSMTPEQKQKVCFAWDHHDAKRGLLRTHVSNNWQITEPHIRSPFYTQKQQDIIHDAFKGLINPEWYSTFLRQLKEDTGGKPWGAEQSIAIFGEPGTEKFEFVMTGRHMTLRCDGNSTEHVAFGGPIFYGHAASGFNEKPNHPGNVLWHQALAANRVYEMLDEKQRKQALVEKLRTALHSGKSLADIAKDQKVSVDSLVNREAVQSLSPGKAVPVA
jgi:hypothetical protein